MDFFYRLYNHICQLLSYPFPVFDNRCGQLINYNDELRKNLIAS
jgi:hypothetical protein